MTPGDQGVALQMHIWTGDPSWILEQRDVINAKPRTPRYFIKYVNRVEQTAALSNSYVAETHTLCCSNATRVTWRRRRRRRQNRISSQLQCISARLASDSDVPIAWKNKISSLTTLSATCRDNANNIKPQTPLAPICGRFAEQHKSHNQLYTSICCSFVVFWFFMDSLVVDATITMSFNGLAALSNARLLPSAISPMCANYRIVFWHWLSKAPASQG